MLYISTRNTADTFTAYHALHEATAPDGGNYVPFYLSVFSTADLLKLRENTCGDAIANCLNLFFGTRICGWNVECAIGRTPFKIETLSQRLIIAETWRNPEGNIAFLVDKLYELVCGADYSGVKPNGWSLIAIKISLLFGIYACMDVSYGERFDIAVPAGDFSDVVAAGYCRSMGLPVGITICACNENSAIWDLIFRGELSTNVSHPMYMETFVYMALGADEVKRYLDACNKKRAFIITEEQQQLVAEHLYASVVSTKRIESVISGMYQSNKYSMDHNAALSYSALQDYRASNGVNNDTLVLAKKRTN